MYGLFNFKNCLSSNCETSVILFYFIFGGPFLPLLCFFSMFIRYILEPCIHAHSILTFVRFPFVIFLLLFLVLPLIFTLHISTPALSSVIPYLCSPVQFLFSHSYFNFQDHFILIDLFQNNLCMCVCSIFS